MLGLIVQGITLFVVGAISTHVGNVVYDATAPLANEYLVKPLAKAFGVEDEEEEEKAPQQN